uniref:Uncharacterized protein n=1 Tax=Onchocerca volvulus TaxID=6282 RepID=A0A8R1TRI5_ONCVO
MNYKKIEIKNSIFFIGGKIPVFIKLRKYNTDDLIKFNEKFNRCCKSGNAIMEISLSTTLPTLRYKNFKHVQIREIVTERHVSTDNMVIVPFVDNDR